MNRNPGYAHIHARSTFWSILHLRCPRCHHGRVFKGLFAMNERCGVCALKFEREPGYFVGAMYISYALASIVVGTAFMGSYLIAPDLSDLWRYIASCVVLLPFVPLIFKYSRVMWMTLDRSIAE